MKIGLQGCALACASLFFSGCTSEPQTAQQSQAVVYDNDSRVDLFDYPASPLRNYGQYSSVAIIRKTRIDRSNPADVQIVYDNLGEKEDLCEGERFASQVAAASCSATLVDRDLILTAGHCVDNLTQCYSRVYVFGYHQQADGNLAPITEDQVYECRRMVRRRDLRSGLDYQFIQLDRPVAPPYYPASVNKLDIPLVEGSTLAVLGYPSGLPLKIAAGGPVLDDGAPQLINFEAALDTFSGNSGSGIYNANDELVGILNRGQDDYRQQGSCFVVDVLSSSTAGSMAEEGTYVGRALEGLCDYTSWVTDLCQDTEGWCRPCAVDSHCPAEFSCQQAAGGGANYCARSCSPISPCRSGHSCQNGLCVPDSSSICLGQEVWTRNSCGRDLERVTTCTTPGRVCEGGGCIPAAPGNSCQNAQVITPVDQTLTGTTGYGLSNEYSSTDCGGSGPERVFRFVLTEPTRFIAQAEGYDSVLYLRSVCETEDSEVECNDDLSDDNRGSRLDLSLQPGIWFLFLDGFRAASGNYQLQLSFPNLSPPDAGVQLDAGIPDSSTVVDAGFDAALPDAEPAPDATVVAIDAGFEDAGIVLMVDMGSEDKENLKKNDGCRAQPKESYPLWLTLICGFHYYRRKQR